MPFLPHSLRRRQRTKVCTWRRTLLLSLLHASAWYQLREGRRFGFKVGFENSNAEGDILIWLTEEWMSGSDPMAGVDGKCS